MKLFGCKKCKKLGEEFLGDRKSIRKHLMEKHGLRGIKTGKRELSIKRDSSQLNDNIIEYDWK